MWSILIWDIFCEEFYSTWDMNSPHRVRKMPKFIIQKDERKICCQIIPGYRTVHYATAYEGVGWKVHRLTKELCHGSCSNETWDALNSIFPDTNCINPHWICNSGLWKVVRDTFRRRPGKLTKGVLFHQDNAPAHKSMVATVALNRWLLCMTVALNNKVDRSPDDFYKLTYSPDLAPSDYILYPNMNIQPLHHSQPMNFHPWI